MPLATNLPGQLTADHLLRLYKEQALVELRHRDLKSNLRVRPIFLHNDDRIQALISIVGLALLIFGLIEFDLRRSLGSQETLPGLLPEGRPARPKQHIGRLPGLRPYLHQPRHSLRSPHRHPAMRPRPARYPPPLARADAARPEGWLYVRKTGLTVG